MLAASVRDTIRRHDMLPAGGRVAVALSGGPDSVALLHILRDLEAAGELVVAGVAHFNHQLRGQASDEDERFCAELAATLGVPIEIGRADVRQAARSEKRSVEDAARRLRYAFLHEAAARLDAHAIAVGHSREDQAETFLLRLLRGAGTRGLASIRPKAGMVIRPLIDISRAELRQFAADRGLNFQDDETNADLAIPRNRVRHELLPYLEREFSPGIIGVLAREAALAREDEERLEKEAIDLAASVVLVDTPRTGASRIHLDLKGLESLPPSLASRVARRALEHLGSERFIGFEHVQRLLDFARSAGRGKALSLPGQQAVHQGDRIILRPEPGRGVDDGANILPVPLSIPGEAFLGSVMVSAAWSDGQAAPAGPPGLAAFVKSLEGPLAIRSRRPGDRFQPPGLGGRARKLQDYLVDRKVPRFDRDLLPLVVDRDDRIVWIVGHAVAEGLRAAGPSPGVILLKARHLGGEV